MIWKKVESVMRFRSFLKLVEIQTKVASMTPLLLGSVYTIYRYRQFSIKNFLLMLISLLCFDMATTAINNYLDYKKAKKKEGFGYEEYNAIVRDGLTDRTVLTVIFSLLAMAVVFGFLLYKSTSPVVLVIGAVSFLVGILYTFGPVPISRMPLGELFSGFFMGFVILFLSIFIHVVDLNIVQVLFKGGWLSININTYDMVAIFMLSLPATFCIANIMLANNICDMKEDLENKRYTLPIYIGKQSALYLFEVLYNFAFLDIFMMSVLGVLPLTALLAVLVIFPVRRNYKLFARIQSKKETFSVAVKNFLMTHAALIALIVVGIFVFPRLPR
jgi:1,4-dihydroxy-2-naphthoate octaprenyltransferase